MMGNIKRCVEKGIERYNKGNKFYIVCIEFGNFLRYLEGNVYKRIGSKNL